MIYNLEKHIDRQQAQDRFNKLMEERTKIVKTKKVNIKICLYEKLYYLCSAINLFRIQHKIYKRQWI